jgi:hypothetical protein
MYFLADTPVWFWIIAFLVSSYHAYRGFMWQWIFGIQQNEDFKRKLSKKEIVILRCIADALFYLICSMAGFLCLIVANNLYKEFANCQTIDAGLSFLMVFSFLIGIIGVSGQLPALIQLGKFPSLK